MAGPLVVKEHKMTDTHKNHSKHMCELTSARKMASVAKLSKGAQYVCHFCGRAAKKAENLCEPVSL